MSEGGCGGRRWSSLPSFDGPLAMRDAWRGWLRCAVDCGARELWWVDRDLAQWPIGERSTIELLDTWAGAGRRLILLLADDEPLERSHPRWVTWRRTWGHLVELRLVEPEQHQALPQLALWPQHLALLWPEKVGIPGRWVRAAADLHRLGDLLRTLLERTSPGKPVKVLGL